MSGLRKRALSRVDTNGSPGSDFLSTLKRFDAYAKPLEDFRVKTASGATVTIISAIIIIFLVLTEFIDWQTHQMLPSLVVDKGRREKMQINMNVTFPHIPCYLLTLDVMDVSGDHQNDIDHSIFKTRIDAQGREVERKKSKPGSPGAKSTPAANNSNSTTNPSCGSCYGAKPEGECCNTCEEVIKAHTDRGWSLPELEEISQCVAEGVAQDRKEQMNEGCNIHGHVQVNKVAGNFHFAPGKSFQHQSYHVHDLDHYITNDKFDFSHNIHSLSYGTEMGLTNPLDQVAKEVRKGHYMYQYFIKVVGTRFFYRNGTTADTNQFSVTENERDLSLGGGGGVPGVFFNYEISPMLVIYTEYKKPFAHFLTDVCAIVGGVFTVASIIDSFIYTAEKTIKKKLDIGKSL